MAGRRRAGRRHALHRRLPRRAGPRRRHDDRERYLGPGVFRGGRREKTTAAARRGSGSGGVRLRDGHREHGDAGADPDLSFHGASGRRHIPAADAGGVPPEMRGPTLGAAVDDSFHRRRGAFLDGADAPRQPAVYRPRGQRDAARAGADRIAKSGMTLSAKRNKNVRLTSKSRQAHVFFVNFVLWRKAKKCFT